jgi:hypothetical protein
LAELIPENYARVQLMSTRGYFNFIANQPAYTEAQKEWRAGLLHSKAFWFDLIVNPPEGCDVQSQATAFLNNHREAVRNSADQRFVYFIASRQRIRFCCRRPPKRSLSRKYLLIHLEVGREKKLKQLRLEIPKDSRQFTLPTFSEDGRFILIEGEEGQQAIALPVHDFLILHEVNLGIDTEVLYVGSTDDPATRPLKRDHRGYGDSVYPLSPEETDVFVFYNIFKVVSVAENSDFMLNFMIANSVIDEVQRVEEGELLEHGLIHYFGTKSQERNKVSEYGRLRNDLKKLLARNKISAITFNIEMEEPHEFYRFFSRNISARDRHYFALRIEHDQVIIAEPEPVKFGC